MQINKVPNTTIQINGKEHLYFSGTSYLGVASLPDFQDIIFENIKKWGSSYGSSRNANIKLDVYERAEKYLSNFLNTEDCVSVSSGTFAGLITLNALENIVDSFFYMPKTHPAILPNNAQPVFEKNKVCQQLLETKNKTICIVADAIAALETTPFNFDFIHQIAKENNIYLLIDESHSLGVLGDKGNGVAFNLQLKNNIEIIKVSSLGKALGVNGGFIAGKKDFINLIREKPLFVGSAPMNPAFLETLINAQDLYGNQLNKLQENCKYVYDKIHHLEKVKISKNYPVFFVDDENVADYLLSKNIVITSFYYPTLNNKKINRVVLNANHTKEQLSFLIKKLTQ
ncbi:aminotransferase class I/II-fold pyridoxal phosphate-dependent enzyme [Polaribacter sp. Hel1_85]|uniref:aminotransferase class I/II-fold pyridoxal phosphate-dependent enzyme n=1 Tax=Polaribacter sp. Hel1_85 TaxID=1250005 RepID=UPI00052B5B1B|nr:aminotransferase class I/II-fold pyridoxal phosphate-dependent enzyme [Polaribacter sp. Hel1_85]KGL61817.1 aminotransferase class I/II [Polaribacter sp. Hel1_85]